MDYITLPFDSFPQKVSNDLNKLINNIIIKLVAKLFLVKTSLTTTFLCIMDFLIEYIVSLSSTGGDCACVS